MTTYFKDLNEGEQYLFNKIERIFVNNSISRISFVKVLGVLINKYRKYKWYKEG